MNNRNQDSPSDEVATDDKLLTQAYMLAKLDRTEGQRERLTAIKYVSNERKPYIPLTKKHRNCK